MKISNRSSAHSKGFTLIEILTVVSIIIVLVGLTLGIAPQVLIRVRIQKATTQIKRFESALQEYEADFGEFPPGDGSTRSSLGLYTNLYENGILNDRKVYMPELDPEQSDQFKKIKNGIILDPFKHKKPYFYLRGVDENGEENNAAFNPDFDLWSLGPNGKGRSEGGNVEENIDDDITNWSS